MKKVWLLFGLILLVSGCSSEYNLKVESDKISENMDIVIEKSMIEMNQAVGNVVDSDDQLSPFIFGDISPFASGNDTYQKTVTEDDNYYYVNLKYDFSPSQYGESRAIQGCFENHEYVENSKFYEIKLSGSFYCLYSDSLAIRLNTPNVVEENNADQIDGDTYIWTIDKSNVQNTDISIKILKKTKWQQYLVYGIIGALILVCGIAIFVFMKIFTNKENRNKI